VAAASGSAASPPFRARKCARSRGGVSGLGASRVRVVSRHHVSVTLAEENLGRFLRRFHGEASCAINALLARESYDQPRNLFDGRSAHSMRLLDAAAGEPPQLRAPEPRRRRAGREARAHARDGARLGALEERRHLGRRCSDCTTRGGGHRCASAVVAQPAPLLHEQLDELRRGASRRVDADERVRVLDEVRAARIEEAGEAIATDEPKKPGGSDPPS